MIKATTKENKKTKVSGSEPTKEEIEKFIEDKWETPEGTTLRICWMPKWDYHYRLNYWLVLPGREKCFYKEERIASGMLVRTEYIGHDWITKEYID